MPKKKIDVKFFSILPENDSQQMALDVFNCLKGDVSFDRNEVCLDHDISTEQKNQYLDKCINRHLLRITDESSKLSFNTHNDEILGIGFRGKKAYLVLVNLANNVIERDEVEVKEYIGNNFRNKDISEMSEHIVQNTKIDIASLKYIGVALPEELIKINPKGPELFAAKFSGKTKAVIYVTKDATAAGYADREFTHKAFNRNVIYMYSDVGTGVILKKESIFEADEYIENKSGYYLRSWNQFSIVNTAKDLISRGVGTDIVHMVHGDMDEICIDIVLEAAEKGDELACDLVKRSGLALGVRVAYLVNMFNVDYVLFGGGAERNEGLFLDSVRESMKKFLNKEKSGKVEIVPGTLGKEASSVGAALLCRRQLFMEV